ncbi:hypothetical protein [Rhodospirillaceae bacterium SYSU D60014]|uniref:hypothetical protein n=1 Tax=Virgifigura deserti TaxID=2268457 RepID=UPI0013C43452
MTSPAQKFVLDVVGIGGAVAFSPVWLQWLESGGKVIAIVGGSLIILGRLWLVYREIRAKRRGD